ncbi:hypothetical protein PanWU01x14_127190, partial [Parasponia andersonii]
GHVWFIGMGLGMEKLFQHRPIPIFGLHLKLRNHNSLVTSIQPFTAFRITNPDLLNKDSILYRYLKNSYFPLFALFLSCALFLTSSSNRLIALWPTSPPLSHLSSSNLCSTLPPFLWQSLLGAATSPPSIWLIP